MLIGGSLSRPAITATPLLYSSYGLPATTGGYGTFGRKLNSSYSGSCIKVRRSSDDALADIGFTAGNELDETALLAHVTNSGANPTANGFVHTTYDQSGNGHNLVMATNANQAQIVSAGVVVKKNGKPAAYVPDTTARGYVSANFAAYTGADVTISFVGAFANNSPTSGNSNRFISLLPVSSSLGDTDNTGLAGIARNTTTQQWATNHGGSSGSNWIINAPAEYARLNSVILCKKGQLYTLNVDGNSVSATETALTNNFNIGRIGLGHTGFSPNTALGTYFSEWHVHFAALTNAQQATILSNQQSYYGTSPLVAITPPTGFDPIASGFTLRAQEDFASGSYQASDWSIYNNGQMTSNAGAWKSSRVQVVQLTDSPYVGQYALEFQTHVNSSVQTLPNGFSYLLEGGAGYWKGPADGRYGVAFQEEGLWRAIYRWVGKGNAATPSKGEGFADLLWPYVHTPDFPTNWPIHWEGDINEVTPSNTNKTGGESNWHFDTVKNSSRHQRQPPTSTTLSQFPSLFTGVPGADVTRQNYGVDWTQWTTVDCVHKAGQYVEMFINGISKGRINFTASNPSPYLPSKTAVASDGTPVLRPYRRTFQTEGYGVSDANRQPGTFALQVKLVAYYSLP